MKPPDGAPGEKSSAIRKWGSDPGYIARRKRQRRLLKRVLTAALAIMVSTFVIIPTMIASGLLFGPRGVEGVLLAPLVLMLTWAAILYLTFRRRVSPRSIVRSDLSRLPAQTEEWLEEQRRLLPSAAHTRLDSLALRLTELSQQVQTLDAATPAGHEVRRLLGEELPELVRGYTKVPRALAQQPLYGGPSPEQQLVEGLDTIEKQLGRVHERLASDDLKAFATHQRYLELKYDNDDEKK